MENFGIKDLTGIIRSIKEIMVANKDYLIELDAKNGDGDLGLSMDSGFSKTYEKMKDSEEKDLGRFMLTVSKTFNEEAPSTLGTLLSIYFMGMAKSLKGKTIATIEDISLAMESGLLNMMEKGGAKPGEKTILDSLYPATEEIKNGVAEKKPIDMIFLSSLEIANKGMLATKDMKSVHGRAAYYGDKSIGIQDGGATVGMYIIKGISNYIQENTKDSR